MTFAELLLFLLCGYVVYRLLRPFQRRLEMMLLRWFGGGKSHKPIIDVTESSRKSRGGKNGNTV
jgi:hypothetical protein